MPKFECTVEDIVFRNESNGWTVASVKVGGNSRTSAVGTMPFLAAGERVIFDGELVTHRDYGEQIKVLSYETLRPETKTGVERYLASGMVKGVGPATAKLIVKQFGKRALDVLESEPERLTEIEGIGPKRARMIAESFMAHNEMRNTLLFLQEAGLSAGMAMRAYKAFGEKTEQVIRQNPYRLADEIDGVSFKTADQIALALGFSRESEFRLMSGIRYALAEAVGGFGHVYLPRERLTEQAARILEADEDMVDNALRALITDGRLVGEEFDGETAVYLPALYDAERDVARLLIRLQKSIRPDALTEQQALKQIEFNEQSDGISLSAEQREAVLAAAESGVLVVTGGPGTGKTTSINVIIRMLQKLGRVELCAPTGRAAKRMTEATGRPARTMHRMLEYAGEGERFARDEENPLDACAVIVDEMSMVDLNLMRALLKALKPGTRLVLVGDRDQLPSVGAGNVLKDIIASGRVSVVTLGEIFRQAGESKIIVNAHRINRGEYPQLQSRDTDFFIERKDSPTEAAESVVGLVARRLPNYKGFDRLRDIQVMAPMKKGDAGVYALNRRLQDALNPKSLEKREILRGETCFRIGDKVMQIKNDYEIEWTRDGENGSGAFNGDVGFLTRINRAEETVTVEFDDGRVAVYDESALDELELAYCISVHKSQGSEFECVVLPLITGPKLLMTRNLLYTAVTRARKLVVLVGRETCVRQMVDNDHIDTRFSMLEARLRAQ